METYISHFCLLVIKTSKGSYILQLRCRIMGKTIQRSFSGRIAAQLPSHEYLYELSTRLT